MSIQSAVLAGRRAAEKLMSSMVEVRRFTGGYTIDPVTAEEIAEFEVVYSGKMKLASYEAYESTPNVADAQVVTVVRLRCDFPVRDYLPHTGDEVHILSDSGDPNLAGKVVRLTTPAPYKSHATAYRVPCEEVING